MPGLLKRGFSGGEVSESLISRTDTAKLQAGMRTLRNFWVTRTGAIQNRPGTRFVTRTKDQGTHVRILPFRFNDDQTYVIEVGEHYFRLVREGGQVYSNEIQAGVTDDVIEEQTLYLGEGDDDLAALTGTHPSSAGPYGPTQPEHKRLRVSEGAQMFDSATTATNGAARVTVRTYTTPSGNPGSAGAWVTGTHTLRVNITSIGAGLSAASLTVRLHRTNSAGVGQEKCDAGSSFDPGTTGTYTSYVPPGGGPTAAVADLVAGGVGVYVFTWTDAEWAGGFSDTDRLSVELIFTLLTASQPQGVIYEIQTADAAFTTPISPGTMAGQPWEAATAYEPGDMVFTEAIEEYGWKWWLHSAVPDFTGDAPSVPSNDQPFASMVDEIPAPGTVPVSIPAVTNDVEVTSFIVDPPTQPGWTQWLHESVTVAIRFGTPSAGTGPLIARVNLQRINAAGQITEGGAETADQTVTAGGAFVYTAAAPVGGWGSSGTALAATDTLRIRVRIENTGPDTFTTTIVTGNADSYVDVPPVSAASGRDYFYCTARHSDKNPGYVIYHDDFWYPQPEDVDGNPILEVPTPYLAEELAALWDSQSADVITMTMRSHPPHELIRTSSLEWPFLPIDFSPGVAVPTGLVADDTGSGTAPTVDNIRYQVTAVQKRTGVESLAGADAATTVSNVTDDSAQSTDEDLYIEATGHGLVDGDEIVVTLVETLDPDRSNENARIALENKTFTVTPDGPDAFTLDDTAGLLTMPVLALIAGSAWPSIQITWAKAYLEFLDKQIPKGTGATKISFDWTEVEGAEQYNIYRSVNGGEYGFLEAAFKNRYVDDGDGNGNPLQADPETNPPKYRNPFRYGDWPKISTYYQQRQMFASSDNNPQRVWGSAIGDFRNFTTRSPLQEDDSLEFAIAGTEVNAIQSMIAFGQLILLTTGTVWSARGNADGVLTPLAINLEPLAYEGAADIRPALVGDSVLFVQARSSIVRDIRFDIGGGSYSGYAGRDLTIFASHLLDGYTLTEMDYAPVPERIVFAVRSDGALLGLTYINEQDIWAWHRHDTRPDTDLFQSLAVIPEQGADAPYFVTQRSIDGADAWQIERMEQWRTHFAGVDPRLVSFFVDCGLTYDGTNTDETLELELTGGTTWLAGETGLTLTASADLFAASDVGNGFRLVGADGEEVEVEVTAFTNATEVTVSLLTDAPASTQGIATASWVAMVDVITELEHLEGEEVVALADLVPLGPFTVSGGEIDLGARPYGIVHVGLAIQAVAEVHDLDFESGDAFHDKQKRVGGCTAFLQSTVGLRAGISEAYLRPFPLESAETPTTLLSAKRRVRFDSRFDNAGRYRLQQDNPQPAFVTALVTHVDPGDR